MIFLEDYINNSEIVSGSNNLHQSSSIGSFNPPDYSSLAPRIPSAPLYPRPSEGNESLPEYRPTIYKEGLCNRKMELLSPYIPANQRSWTSVYLQLNNTQLNIFSVVSTHSGNPAPDNDLGYDELDVTYTTNNSKDSLPLLDHELSTKSPLKATVYNDKCFISKLLRSYTLQHADVGIANDYKKRSYVLRLRAEGEQILLQFPNPIDFIAWANSIQSAIDVSLPLDERPFPITRFVPRRERRPETESEAVTQSAESSSNLSFFTQGQPSIISRTYPNPYRGNNNNEGLQITTHNTTIRTQVALNPQENSFRTLGSSNLSENPSSKINTAPENKSRISRFVRRLNNRNTSSVRASVGLLSHSKLGSSDQSDVPVTDKSRFKPNAESDIQPFAKSLLLAYAGKPHKLHQACDLSPEYSDQTLPNLNETNQDLRQPEPTEYMPLSPIVACEPRDSNISSAENDTSFHNSNSDFNGSTLSTSSRNSVVSLSSETSATSVELDSERSNTISNRDTTKPSYSKNILTAGTLPEIPSEANTTSFSCPEPSSLPSHMCGNIVGNLSPINAGTSRYCADDNRYWIGNQPDSFMLPTQSRRLHNPKAFCRHDNEDICAKSLPESANTYTSDSTSCSTITLDKNKNFVCSACHADEDEDNAYRGDCDDENINFAALHNVYSRPNNRSGSWRAFHRSTHSVSPQSTVCGLFSIAQNEAVLISCTSNQTFRDENIRFDDYKALWQPKHPKESLDLIIRGIKPLLFTSSWGDKPIIMDNQKYFVKRLGLVKVPTIRI